MQKTHHHQGFREIWFKLQHLLDLLHGVLGVLPRISVPFPGLEIKLVDLRIDLPYGPLRVKARVAESSIDGSAPPGAPGSLAGLEFLGLSAADGPRLRAFLESESRRSAGADKASS